jgi:hypothetical protein
MTNNCSAAYNLNLLLSQHRHSVVDATIVRTPAPIELEYLDAFDFFNYPRLPDALRKLRNMPDSATPPGSLASVNGFPKMDFAMPNPESDWLAFRPPHD